MLLLRSAGSVAPGRLGLIAIAGQRPGRCSPRFPGRTGGATYPIHNSKLVVTAMVIKNAPITAT